MSDQRIGTCTVCLTAPACRTPGRQRPPPLPALVEQRSATATRQERADQHGSAVGDATGFCDMTALGNQ
jgi:hypothetical protein